MQGEEEKNASAENSIISILNVHKRYRLGEFEVPVLRGVNLEIRPGEFLVVMGPSGSGKSTLMNMIGCLDRPTEGKVLFRGKDINSLSDGELAKLRGLEIGFVFQTFNLIPRLNALENVKLPSYANSKPGLDPDRRARALLKTVGLEDRMYHKPNELSGGQSQRVAIARALINDPALILADEPTGNLDSKTSLEIMELFSELNRQGRTVIMITHDPEVVEYAERVVYIKDGLVREGKAGAENKEKF